MPETGVRLPLSTLEFSRSSSSVRPERLSYKQNVKGSNPFSTIHFAMSAAMKKARLPETNQITNLNESAKPHLWTNSRTQDGTNTHARARSVKRRGTVSRN